ncbi:MAG TPA: Mor transcription activator family protein [Syntrophomonadaceae bacterium]|nr:Mor transcription activator family protein [Syntrophomonadaceae bacterium]
MGTSIKNQEWVKEIQSELLPEPYRKLSEEIGVENVLVLAEEFQGTSVYFPKLDGLLKSLRDHRIRDEYNGHNGKDLARKYGLTEVWIRSILNECPVESSQMNLFEDALLGSQS